jgi:enoyl-[acyl-carrier protein] reductase II
MGSRFVASEESSAHIAFKKAVVSAGEGDTRLALKKLIPVRLLNNDFAQKVALAETEGKSAEELREILGKARAKKGMFEGDLREGELEIGQISALIDKIKPVKNIISDIILEYRVARSQIDHVKFDF